MKRVEWLQEIRRMRFEEAYEGWTGSRLTQEEAAGLLGVCTRTFGRHVDRYEEGGMAGLQDRRITVASHRRAPVDEQMRLVDRYRSRHAGWNVRHFHAWYRRSGGGRGYPWVKHSLQQAGVVKRAAKRGAHRKRREASPLPGMMLHQDGSTHEWVSGQRRDLIVTLDDATSEHYSLFFCAREGTASSFRGVREVIESRGLSCSLHTDRGSHYWHTPQAGGKVDKRHPTQSGRAMKQLGIEMMAAYSPQARGRCERVFKTHQDRLVKELHAAGIRDMSAANRYLPACNEEFRRPARESGSAFAACQDTSVLADILCEHHERTVGHDNCVKHDRRAWQMPADRHRCHHVKVLSYADGSVSIRHGPRELARYDGTGKLMLEETKAAA